MLKEQHIMPHLKNSRTDEKQNSWHVSVWKGYKAILRLWDSSEPWSEPLSTNGENLEQWWTFPGVAGLPQITPRAQRRLIQEVIKNPEQHLKNCRPHLPQQIKVSVHDSTTRKRLGKNDIQSSKAKKTQRLVSHLPKNMLIIPKTFGQIFCGLMRQKLNFLCPIASGVKPTQHLIKKNIIPTVKHWW